MNVQEKQAWFVLIVAGITIVTGLALLAVFGLRPGVFACFGIFGFAGFAAFIGLRERKSGMVIMDERDRQIALNATTGAYSVFWVLFVLTAMGPFAFLGPDATLTLKTTTICSVIFPAIMIVFVVRSLIVVVLYWRGRHV